MDNKKRVQVLKLLKIKLTLLQAALEVLDIRKDRGAVKIIWQRRREYGDGHHLIRELQFEETGLFFNYTRLNVERFEYILSRVGPLLKKRNIFTVLTPVQRLAMTLRFLAVGDCLKTLSFAYRCAPCTVSVIVRETMEAIIDVLEGEYLRPPSTPEEWRAVAAGFWSECQFPHTLGAIDGKHINIQAPAASGSLYFNYKKFFSLVLLGVCDAEYNFLLVDIGAEGSLSDGAIFNQSPLGEAIRNGTLGFPEPTNLPQSNVNMPYFFIGDAAFPLLPNLMKPYGARNLIWSEIVYNYRISRARRMIENTFGILVARWQIFKKPINAGVDTVVNIVKTTVILHNFIKKTGGRLVTEEYCPPSFVDTELQDHSILGGEWRDFVDEQGGAITEGPRLGARNARRTVQDQRDEIRDYVHDFARLEWQDRACEERVGTEIDE